MAESNKKVKNQKSKTEHLNKDKIENTVEDKIKIGHKVKRTVGRRSEDKTKSKSRDKPNRTTGNKTKRDVTNLVTKFVPEHELAKKLVVNNPEHTTKCIAKKNINHSVKEFNVETETGTRTVAQTGVATFDKTNTHDSILIISNGSHNNNVQLYSIKRESTKPQQPELTEKDKLLKDIEKEKRLKVHNCLPWIEKHRPSKITNVKIDKHIKAQIENMINNRDLPNIILDGPPGVGKTSTIKCIARAIYGKYYNDMVLEMNASDDRGIRIQDSIENFRKAYVHISEEDRGKTPVFKMVILDEADNMTDKAKHIINGFIKNCVDDLRFAFTCNAKDNIIPSIQSGCHIVKYPPLKDEIIDARLREICVMEGVINKDTGVAKIKEIEKGINAITQITNGDMRCAINMLQLIYNRYEDVTVEKVYSIHDKPHPEKSKEIIMHCVNEDLGEAIEKVLDMRRRGYSGTDITLGLHFALRLDICADIPEAIKLEFWKCISYASYNISKGMDASVLQITACISDMCKSVRDIKGKDKTMTIDNKTIVKK